MYDNDDTNARINRVQLRAFYTSLTTFRDLSVTMPVGEVMAFLTVALNEGASLKELSDKMDMKMSTTSRYLLDLSDKTRTGAAGYGLVNREVDPNELRRNMYSLTPNGRKIVSQLSASVRT